MPRQGRSRGNGFGLSVSETDRLARVIERDFEFLPDSQAVQIRWRRLLVEYEVKGVQVHDTRLAASMFVHAIPQLLTINVSPASWICEFSTPPMFLIEARIIQ